MDRFLEQFDKESMKMAVLKHEEIFKEQVYELHRLYRIQKLLMNDVQRKGLETPLSSIQNSETGVSLSQSNYIYKEEQRLRSSIDLERPACYNGEAMSRFEQEIDIELRLGRGYNQMKKDETSLATDCWPSFSSSSTDSSAMQNSVGTLQSINTTQVIMGHDWGLFRMPATNVSFQSEKMNSFVVDEQLGQERAKQPPWLFHVVSW
ncbi:hypothetical protein AAC387_Pa05g1986 [Persea americana]